MKKKCLAMLLAAVMVMMLLPTAFAKDLKDATEQDILTTFTIYRNGTIDETKGDYLSDTPARLSGAGDDEFYEREYHVISKNDTFTITNTGSKEISASGDTDYDISVYLSVLHPVRNENRYMHTYLDFHLGADGHFIYSQDYLESIDAGAPLPLLQLKAGESVTIPVSTMIEADGLGYDPSPIYALSISVNYKGYNWEDYKDYSAAINSSMGFYFLIDEARKAQVDASLAGTGDPTEAEDPVSGSCGENVTWSYSGGTLTIEGTGPMEDYRLEYYDKREDIFVPAPWYDYREQIHTVIIGEGVTSIGDVAFLDCVSLTGVTIPDSVTSIGKYAFRCCDSLTEVTIPDGVISIGELAFQYCGSLTDVTIPDSVTTVDRYAFSYCVGLTNVIISNNITAISAGLFYECGVLTSVNIPDGVTSIGHRAFEYCESLTGVTIPGSVTYIGVSAFSDCGKLTDITIPDSVTAMEHEAFSNCGSLTEVTIPGSIATTGSSVFSGCSSLTSATISNGVTTIDYDAFARCGKLTDITIPDSVTTIEQWAFWGCDSLKNVYYSGSESQWEEIDINNDYDRNAPLLNANIHYNSTGPETEDPGETETPDIEFTDVNKGDWYYDDLQWAVKNGWVNGYPDGSFKPENDCIEEDVLVLLYRAVGSPESDAELPDSLANRWSADALRWALEQGMIDETFNPNDPGSRAKTIYYLWQAYGSQSAEEKASFPDVDEDADYIDALSWAVEEGIVKGYDNGTFRPDNPFQRQHLVRLLHWTVEPEARQ